MELKLQEKLKAHGVEISNRIGEIESQITELRSELRQLKELKRVLDPASIQSKKKKQWGFRMTKVERMEKLKIVHVIEDRIVELQRLIADKEDKGVMDDTLFQLLFELEELSEFLVKRNQERFFLNNETEPIPFNNGMGFLFYAIDYQCYYRYFLAKEKRKN